MLLVLAAGVVLAAGKCTTGRDCSLNGECGDGGVCICSPGWHGNECEVLNLGTSQSAVHGTNGTWTWGGSVIRDEDTGLWHLFFSSMEMGCGLLHYQTNSVVKHAVSESRDGPWTVGDQPALQPRDGYWDSGAIHGPTILQVDGVYLLYYMGTTVTTPRPNCWASPSTLPVMNSSSRRIGLAWSKDIAPGKVNWQRLTGTDRDGYNSGMILAPRAPPHWDSSDVSNAAPLILKNGTVMLGYRAGGDGVALAGGIGIAFASRWNRTYTRKVGADGMLFAAEDAAMYRDTKGHFHMLAHRFAAGNGSTVGSAVGGHAYSSDGLVWTLSPHAAYNTTVHLEAGKGDMVLYRRERPKPVFSGGGGGGGDSAAGVGGDMVGLWNGAWPCHVGAEGDDTKDAAADCESFTLFTEVVQ